MRHTLYIQNTLSFSIAAGGHSVMFVQCVRLLLLNLGPAVFANKNTTDVRMLINGGSE